MMFQNVKPTPWGMSEILECLPHRYPFLLVDRVEKIWGGTDASSVGRTILARKNVTVNEPFFQGHFPGKPIMPGVLLVEAMAQACALCTYNPLPSGQYFEFLMVAADGVRFRKPVVPGDVLELQCVFRRERAGLFCFDCEARVDGQLVSEAALIAKRIAVTRS